jgi:hypothetical protein
MNTKINKQIGIWLDHSQAHFIDISKGPAIVETTYADEHGREHFAGEAAIGTKLGPTRATNNEHHVHNIEREVLSGYYNLLADRLKAYDDIYLFGPTGAKFELYNILAGDKHFKDKNIRIEASDNMTENQMVARVKYFFNM